jgi:hypothetical protein
MITPSAAKVRAFSMARAFEPGMYRTDRRGRMVILFPPSSPAKAGDPV